MMGAPVASQHIKDYCEVVRWKSKSLSGSPGATGGRMRKKPFWQKGQKHSKRWPGEVLKTRWDTLPEGDEVELLLPRAGMDQLSPVLF